MFNRNKEDLRHTREEDIEDIVGEVKYSDSQKSISTSNPYSLDFTDASSSSNSNSDKKGSLSGKETYVIEWDSEDSDNNYQLHDSKSVVNLYNMAAPQACKVNVNVQYESNGINRSACTSFHRSTLYAQETFTQTSKTLIELVESDSKCESKPVVVNSLETQTSFISIKENETVEYLIEVSSGQNTFRKSEVLARGDSLKRKPAYYNITCNRVVNSSTEDTTEGTIKETAETTSSKLPLSEVSDSENELAADVSSVSLNHKVIKIVEDDSKDNDTEDRPDMTSEFSVSISDVDADALTGTSNGNKSDMIEVKNLVKEYTELISAEEDQLNDSFVDPEPKRIGSLTPLTEESVLRKDSIIDVTPNDNILEDKDEKKQSEKKEDEVLFMNNGIKIKLLKEEEMRKEPFKLPPIHQSCPNSPHLSTVLAASKVNRLFKAGTLPCLYEGERPNNVDRWEMESKELASGEGTLISGRGVSDHKKGLQLPPIHAEGGGIMKMNKEKEGDQPNPITKVAMTPRKESISIKEKIKELKMCTRNVRSYTHTKYSSLSRTESRSNSPGSVGSRDEHKLSEVVDRGCEVLCLEILRRLRLPSWYDVMNTLDEVPKTMERYWNVISETRIADIIRQINMHMESPRPQVVRSACSCLACVLKNTNYTKKPDFYESMTTLLTKTGSYSRPVRRAANVALDEVVCGVDICHSVSAVCVHGACHKSALVRCSTARLLVVCCALASGGRDLLKTRPTTAATARRHALRALSSLLEDKNTDARKYAERLYTMLRPLSNFEAYYLTDVDVEIASRQMKKYDKLLQIGTDKDTR